MPEQLCIRCNKYPPFQHPHTGRVYKLCPACGLKALAQVVGLEVDEHYNFVPISVQVRSGRIDANTSAPCGDLSNA